MIRLLGKTNLQHTTTNNLKKNKMKFEIERKRESLFGFYQQFNLKECALCFLSGVMSMAAVV